MAVDDLFLNSEFGPVHKVRMGEGEDLLYLERVRIEFIRVGYKADKGCDTIERGNRHSIVERSQYFNILFFQPYLLAALPQCGDLQISVIRMTATARKGYLPLVMVQMSCTLGKDYVAAPALLINRDEHG